MNTFRDPRRPAAAALLCGLLAGCTLPAFPSALPLPPTAAATETASPFLPQPKTSSTAPSPTPSHFGTNTPAPSPSPEEITMTPTAEHLLAITILYNNIAFDPRLQTDWGFSALVERDGTVLLFDTGGNGRILMNNMQVMGVDPARVRYVVLSHVHADHTGGLPAFLEASTQPPVYLLSGFGPSFVQSVRNRTQVVEAEPGMEITPGILTTGNVGGSIPEQSLVIRTGKGLVVVTGCAHPGIVRIVEKAVELTGESVYLVLGGFHLGDHSRAQISAILADFRRLGVQNVAPSHCTGDRAISMFAAEYGENFLRTGAGSILRLDE
jgi:7,8-dihydropterin-6-yl-methyl-4-(beta-D-ribofuranosyl)aminobenzene 5'-phosphate synthase